MLAPKQMRTEPPVQETSANVRAVALVSGVSLERDLTLEEISEHLKEEDSLLWVDVVDPGPEELSLLLEIFGFHPLAVEDVARGRQRPKIDDYKVYSFVVTYAASTPKDDSRQIDLIEIDLFIGRNYLVTVHRSPAPALDDAMGRWTRGGVMMKEGVGFLVYTVMDAIIDTFFPIIERAGDQVEEIETEMFTRFNNTSVDTLLKAKRTLFEVRRVI